jgi:hypothetical protein
MSPVVSRLTGVLGWMTAAVLIGVACGGGGDAKNATSRFSDPKQGYGFDYPKPWQDVTAKVKLAAGQAGRPNLLGQIALGNFDDKLGLFSGAQVSVVGIDHEVKSENLDTELVGLDDLFQKFSVSVAGRENDPQSGQLGGLSARQYVVQFVYHSGAQDEQIATAQTVTFLGNRQYTVNCQGLLEKFDSDIRPGCEKVLMSFRFLK